MSQARSTLSEALRLRPNHGGVLLNLATLEHQLKHPTKAEGMYRRAVRAVEADVKRCGNCQPSMTELAKVQANYGGLLLQLGRAQEATTVLEAGAPWDAAVESARAPGLYHLCLAYRALGRRERATLFCRASLAAKGTAAVEAMLADLETDVEVDGLR
ncbi:unnamed protein product [Durusdinium trenchii]|uniref:Tetratricopeptide repeat protein n=1 Tax=Durusdinium trenchii TaxID=1381693 RepID=A0ABP0IN24_9DINO